MVRRAAIELALIGFLYIGYSASRLLASTDIAPAHGRALDILSFEKAWRIDIESWLKGQFPQHDRLGVFGSFWYAKTHHIVTAIVLIWIYRHSAASTSPPAAPSCSRH